MTEQPLDELWRDMAADSSDNKETLLSATLAEVRRQRGRRRSFRFALAASLVAIPLALAAMAWQLGLGSPQQIASHPPIESLPVVIEPAQPESTGVKTTPPPTVEKKRPRGKVIVIEETAPVPPEWNVVELTDEELLAAIPVPAKLVDTPTGKELVFQKEDQKSIPKIEPNPRRLPSRGVTLLSRTR